jgi:carbamoyl-phosphate synthase large subunit
LFGRALPAFERLGVKVAVSPETTSRICNDKHALCAHLRNAGIASAQSWLPNELPAEPSFPLFIKPREGRGGVSAFAVRTRRELDFFLEYVGRPVVQEFLIGREYTIDLLCGFDHQPRSVVPRERVVVRAGVTDRGRTVNDPALVQLGLDCASALDFAGPVNIQCRVVDGTPVVFEINPRFSGGIPLTIAAGADFPRMIVDLARGHQVPSSIGLFQDGLIMTSYEDALYLEQRDMATLRQPAEVSAPRPWPVLTRQVA